MINVLSRLRRNIPDIGGDTGVQVASISPATSKLLGGATATLKGFNFRNQAGGSAPIVKVGGVSSNGVVVVDGNTITFTIPVGAAVGTVDITVTIDGNVGTLASGFTYYSETILSIEPQYGPFSGGTKFTIRGVNFDPSANYHVLFGVQEATDVAVLDSTTIVGVTPNAEAGFVSVYLTTARVMFAPAIFSSAIFNETSQAPIVLATLSNGFQFTLLVRGEDIRRTPGVTVQESLGAPPSTCSFTIDGNSNAPTGGEKIEIRDSADGNRLLWAGTVQTIDQRYEGQITQLAWDAKCVDFTWLANRRRPIGAWFQKSASQVVKELIGQCCPGFTTNHVQTNLGKITLICDGSQDLITVLNDIAARIGGGHWYFDFLQDTHFFHIVPASVATGIDGLPPISTGIAAGSFPTLAAGASFSSIVNYPVGFYAIRTQFVYDDGSETGLSAWSNLVKMDGTKLFAVSNVAIGPTIKGRTCTKRRLWYHCLGIESGVKIHTLRPFCEIQNNTTQSFTSFFGATGASDAAVVAIDPSVKVPDGANVNTPAGPSAAPSAVTSSQLNGDPLIWMGSYWSYRYAFLYRDGSLSFASPASPPVGNEYMQRGFMLVTARVGVAPGPNIDTNNDCIARLVYQCQGLPKIQGYSESKPDPPGFPVGYGAFIEGFRLNAPDWQTMITRGFSVIPDNVTDHIHACNSQLNGDPYYGAGTGVNNNDSYFSANSLIGLDVGGPAALGTVVSAAEELPTFSPNDASFVFTADPIPVWPNEDGPYLEDTDPPQIIDDNNSLLLFDEMNGFKLTTDISQVRNRIFVIGAGSVLARIYSDGSLQLYVSDVTNFALSGGKFRIEDPANGNTELAEYRTLQQQNGVPYIELKKALSYKYSVNSVIYNFYQSDDLESQKFFARHELDAFGSPTDGVHEYTITDSSLKTVWQMFMRAQAELELYSRPILTINFATRDPNARIGRLQEVDLTSPPCKGTFLIQSVTIDQIQEEADLTVLSPRYSVTASSIRYGLNDLLLKILAEQERGGSSISVGGITGSGAGAAVATVSSAVNTVSFTISDGVLKQLNPTVAIAGLPALSNGVYMIIQLSAAMSIVNSSAIGFNMAFTINYAAPSNRVAIGSNTAITGGLGGLRYIASQAQTWVIQSTEDLLNRGMEIRFAGQASSGFSSAYGLRVMIAYAVLLTS